MEVISVAKQEQESRELPRTTRHYMTTAFNCRAGTGGCEQKDVIGRGNGPGNWQESEK